MKLQERFSNLLTKIDFNTSEIKTLWIDLEKAYSTKSRYYHNLNHCIYPDFLYNPGRKKALEHFLENEFIFQTNEFRRLFEENARANIQQEILLLT